MAWFTLTKREGKTLWLENESQRLVVRITDLDSFTYYPPIGHLVEYIEICSTSTTADSRIHYNYPTNWYLDGKLISAQARWLRVGNFS